MLDVEVHGDPLAPPSKDPVAAGSVIRADRLQSPGLTAGDVLRTQPGVAVSDTGGYGALSTASVRGATAAQTPVYLAGVRLNDDVGGWADLSLVPLWLLHRVEIYRSNAPLEGDQLGIGGAIFFEPKRPRGPEGGVGEMLGSFGARAIWAHAGAGNEKAAAIVGVRLQEATNDYLYVNNMGTQANMKNWRVEPMTNADAHTIDAWALASARLGKEGRVDLVVNEVERRQGMPKSLWPSQEARASVSRQLAALTVHLPCGKPGCDVATTTSLLVSRSGYDDPLREVDLDTTHLDVTGSRVEEAVLVHWPVIDRLVLQPSLRVALERLALVPQGAPSLHAERTSGRAALGAEWQVHELVGLRATGSVECDGTAALGPSPWAGDTTVASASLSPCSEAEPAARLGVQIGKKPLVFLVNGGRYARIPTLAEKFGISGVVRGNAGLAAEHGLTADAGVRASAPARWGLGDAAIDLFGFVRYATDLIAYEHTSFSYVRPYNVGAARLIGGELAATVSPWRALRLDLAATVLDPRDVSPNRTITSTNLIPYEARFVITPRIEAKIPVPTRALRTVKMAASYFYEAARFTVPAGLPAVAAQGSLDLEVEMALLDDHLSLRGRLSNLLDQPRTDFVGYPLPGRAGYATLESRW